VAINEISNHYIKTFEANVQHLVQQKTSKLRNACMVRMPGATISHAFRIVDARGAMTAKTSGTNAAKRPATPYANTVLNDRVAIPQAYGTADSFEWDDVVRMIEDPNSILTTAMAAQVGRTFDDVILAALLGNAPDSAGTANALPVAQQLGGAAVAPDFSLIKTVRESILEKDIDPDEECFLCVSPNLIANLLTDAKATSTDWVNGQALMKGNVVQGWMGFTWIASNRLNHPVVGPPAQTYAFAWTRDAMGLVVNKDIFTEIGKDPGQSFSTTVYVGCDIGAVRVQDSKVFRVHYLETN
jgi:hypothetical protein